MTVLYNCNVENIFLAIIMKYLSHDPKDYFRGAIYR